MGIEPTHRPTGGAPVLKTGGDTSPPSTPAAILPTAFDTGKRGPQRCAAWQRPGALGCYRVLDDAAKRRFQAVLVFNLNLAVSGGRRGRGRTPRRERVSSCSGAGPWTPMRRVAPLRKTGSSASTRACGATVPGTVRNRRDNALRARSTRGGRRPFLLQCLWAEPRGHGRVVLGRRPQRQGLAAVGDNSGRTAALGSPSVHRHRGRPSAEIVRPLRWQAPGRAAGAPAHHRTAARPIVRPPSPLAE